MIRRSSFRAFAVDAYLFVRGVLYFGRRHECPCCGWRLRSFVAGGGGLAKRAGGYCPRCNSKARHRRVWLHLTRDTATLDSGVRVLAVAPHESIARALAHRTGATTCSIDIVDRRTIDVIANAERLPIAPAAFDGVISVHVLEHLDRDEAAMREMWRVLKPNGWAVVNVPCEWDSTTIEDPSITDPNDRRRVFGEADHRRRYGCDLVDRLNRAGFQVEVALATDLAPQDVDRYGLSRSEHVFSCRRAEESAV